MLGEAMEWLAPSAGQILVDATLGGAGYTRVMSKAVGRSGKIYSFDLDQLAQANAETLIKAEKLYNVQLIKNNFGTLAESLTGFGLPQVQAIDGIVFDLGLSSAHLADSKRGFAFATDGPLDMSFGDLGRNDKTTNQLVNEATEAELAKIIRQFGEEPRGGQVARVIVKARQLAPITTTGQLVDIIAGAFSPKERHKIGRHFATRAFQALRIATNQELAVLEQALLAAVPLLKPNGRIVVVSYHSLEDRIVKQFFREQSLDCICPPELPICSCTHRATLRTLTKKPILPTLVEIERNPRSRSAKLRAAQKI